MTSFNFGPLADLDALAATHDLNPYEVSAPKPLAPPSSAEKLGMLFEEIQFLRHNESLLHERISRKEKNINEVRREGERAVEKERERSAAALKELEERHADALSRVTSRQEEEVKRLRAKMQKKEEAASAAAAEAARQIAARDLQISERDTIIDDMKSSIADRDRKIKAQDCALRDAENDIKTLKSCLKDKEAQLARNKIELSTLRSEIDELTAERNALEEATEDLRANNEELERQKRAIEEQVEELETAARVQEKEHENRLQELQRTMQDMASAHAAALAEQERLAIAKAKEEEAAALKAINNAKPGHLLGMIAVDGIKGRPVKVAAVKIGGSAHAAGILDGDRIIHVSSTKTTNLKEIHSMMAACVEGTAVEIGILRGGDLRVASVVVDRDTAEAHKRYGSLKAPSPPPIDHSPVDRDYSSPVQPPPPPPPAESTLEDSHHVSLSRTVTPVAVRGK